MAQGFVGRVGVAEQAQDRRKLHPRVVDVGLGLDFREGARTVDKVVLIEVFGHPAGDAVLVAFAKLLQSRSRNEDIACRLGGEEFMVLMPHTDLQHALTVAERIRSALAGTLIEPLSAPVTASFGAAELTAGETGDALLHRADRALYAAKDSGRNRVVAG